MRINTNEGNYLLPPLQDCANAVSWAVKCGYLDVAEALLALAKVVHQHEVDMTEVELAMPEPSNLTFSREGQTVEIVQKVIDACNTMGPIDNGNPRVCNRRFGHDGHHDFHGLMI